MAKQTYEVWALPGTQPPEGAAIFVRDLAQAMLDCVDKPMAFDEILGKLLGKTMTVKETALTGFLDAHPEYSGHLCHRIYDLSKLKAAGIPLPKTGLEEGLKNSWSILDIYKILHSVSEIQEKCSVITALINGQDLSFSV